MIGNKFHTLFCLVLAICFSCQIDDSTSPSPGDTFLKYYGDDGAQEGQGLLFLEDEGTFLIYGVQNTSVEGSSANLYMLIVDEQGNELRSGSFDFQSEFTELNTNAADDIPGSVVYDPSLGFVYVGSSTRFDVGNNSTFNALVWAQINVNLDSTLIASGEIIQADTTVQNDGNQTVDFKDVSAKDVVVIDGTELLIVGSSSKVQSGDLTEPADEDETQIYTARVSLATGEVLRERTNGFIGNDEGLYIDQFGDDDFVIVGTTENRSGTDGLNTYFLPITGNGVPLEGSSIGFPIGGADRSASETVFDVFKRPNGYVITGASIRGTESNPFFINVSYFGGGNFAEDVADTISVIAEAPNDNNQLVTQSLNAGASAITLGDNGNYFVAGSILSYPGDPGKAGEILILQSDQEGDLVPGTVRNYGLVSGNDAANEILSLEDGSLLILTTVDFGGNTSLIGLMKVNQSGDLMN